MNFDGGIEIEEENSYGNLGIMKHNFRQVDALPYSKEGKLDELIEELFGE